MVFELKKIFRWKKKYQTMHNYGVQNNAAVEKLPNYRIQNPWKVNLKRFAVVKKLQPLANTDVGRLELKRSRNSWGKCDDLSCNPIQAQYFMNENANEVMPIALNIGMEKELSCISQIVSEHWLNQQMIIQRGSYRNVNA